MKKIAIVLVPLFLSITVLAQQEPDTLFTPTITNPAYPAGNGPVVLIDEAHHNFHTMNGRYKPFSTVVMSDGYSVKASAEVINSNVLVGGKILVIANALHESNTGQWGLPTPSAFTDDEVAAINHWVKEGGSLFLIADHMPFPGASKKLAESFGVTFHNGFAMKKKKRDKDIFTLQDGGIKESVLTTGRDHSEKVATVQTFTGQGFEIPDGAMPIILLNDDYEILLPEVAWQFTKFTQSIPAANLVQGAYLKYGAGRAVFFGEAAMFTAQRQGKNKFGLNATDSVDNLQLLLNILHWLDGQID